MTNQNNELDRILETLLSVKQDGFGNTQEIAEAHQAIEALYAPKPVENGELREQVELLTNKYKAHAYEGEVEQTVDAIQALLAQEKAKAYEYGRLRGIEWAEEQRANLVSRIKGEKESI